MRRAPTGVTVELGERAYSVVVGRGAVEGLPDVIDVSSRRVAVVTQEGIPVQVDSGREQRLFTIGDGEAHKTLATVESLCREMVSWGMTRDDVIVGVGGGLVTDVAGFCAAVYHRGIDVVHVPTTLLGQVDAAIGGKTAVNLPEGKNLVGAYWQPRAVLCDLDALDSLPPAELRGGLGELAKYHFIGDTGPDDADLQDRVAAAVRIKAEVVAADEREGGRRAILNYGHTLGHALEIEGSFGLRHGEAVAIGLVYAAELARVLGRIGDERVAEHRRVVSGYDLGVDVPPGADQSRLVELMERDKKARTGMTFVLDGPDGVEVVTDIDRRAIEAAFDAMAAQNERTGEVR